MQRRCPTTHAARKTFLHPAFHRAGYSGVTLVRQRTHQQTRSMSQAATGIRARLIAARVVRRWMERLSRIEWACGGATRRPISIQPYTAEWSASFAHEQGVLEPVLRRWLVMPIEHIGSTAVPGLDAKPIVDMLAVVLDIHALPETFSGMAPAGWVRSPQPGERELRRRGYCKPSIRWRTHHLHIVEQSDPRWPTWLRFRDRLREDEVLRDQYVALNRRLAAADPADRERYHLGKDAFIKRASQ